MSEHDKIILLRRAEQGTYPRALPERRCFALEIEPLFCDVAVKRWEAFTGKTAERIAP